MNENDHANRKASSWKVIFKYGWSNALVLPVTAGIIWGLFPLFYANEIVAETASNSRFAFLAVRFAATLLLYAILNLVFLFRRHTRSALFALVKEKSFWRVIVLAGVLQFMARTFEMYAYGDEGELISFALIYSVFLVPIWDAKGWLISMLKTVLPDSLSSVRLVLEPFASGSPDAIRFLLWLTSSVLIFTSGIFVFYSEIGRLPEQAEFSALGWCLASSLCLSFFFDLIGVLSKRVEKDDSAGGVLTVLAPVAFMQMSIAGFAFLTAVPLAWYNGQAGAAVSATTSFMTDGPAALAFFGGIVFLGTLLAYVFEHLGMHWHDGAVAKYGSWKITGRDWLSVIATIDPLVAVVVISAMGHSSVSPYWLLIPAITIFCVASIGFVELWSEKVSEFRREAFGEEYMKTEAAKRSASFDNVTQAVDQLKQGAANLTRLMLYSADRSDKAVVIGNTSPVLLGVDDFPPSSIAYRFLRELTRTLRQDGEYAVGPRPDCAFIFVANGRKWFEQRDVEKMLAFDALVAASVFPNRNSILRVEDGLRIIGKLRWSNTEAVSLHELHEELYNHDALESARGVREEFLPLILFNDSDQTNQAITDVTNIAVVVDDTTSQQSGLSAVEIREAILDAATEVLPAAISVGELIDADLVFVDCKSIAELAKKNEVEDDGQFLDWLMKKPVVFYDVDTILPQFYGCLGLPDRFPLPIVMLGQTRGEALAQVIQQARQRSRIAPRLIVIDDSTEERRKKALAASIPLIGTGASCDAPNSFQEAISLLDSIANSQDWRREPLVLLDYNLTRWDGASNGIDLAHDYAQVCNPHLFSEVGQFERDFPTGRRCSTDRHAIASTVGRHIGVRDRCSPWSTPFASMQMVASNLSSQISQLSVEVESGEQRDYCHALFLKQRETT